MNNKVVLVTGRRNIGKKMPGESLLRSFAKSRSETCRYVSHEHLEKLPPVVKQAKILCTGSSYAGNRNHLGWHGYGVYTFSDGCVYSGYFDDGQLHGNGELTDTGGNIIRGSWDHGKLVTGVLYFKNGMQFSKSGWTYLMRPDRRFYVEIEYGVQPAGLSYKTATQPTRKIPPGHYDTGDGFYNSETRVIFSYECLNTVVRSPSLIEQKWIIDNCRRAEDGPVGFHSELYEVFYQPTKYFDDDTSTEDEQSLVFGDLDYQNQWEALQKERRSRMSAWSIFNKTLSVAPKSEDMEHVEEDRVFDLSLFENTSPKKEP